MSPLLILVTTAALGIEVGWEPLPSGGHEYRIQIEPQLLGLLEKGTDEIVSDVPAGLDVRRYRITVGTGKLPRDAGPPPAEAEPRVPAAAVPAPSGPEQPPPAEPKEPERPPPEAKDPFALPDIEAKMPPSPTPAMPTPSPEKSAQDEPQPQPKAAADKTAAEPGGAPVPGRLPRGSDAPAKIEQATFDDGAGKKSSEQESDARESHKPALGGEAQKPWPVLVGSVVLLCCSLGANIYLGWMARDARARYRNAVAKLRAAAT